MKYMEFNYQDSLGHEYNFMLMTLTKVYVNVKHVIRGDIHMSDGWSHQIIDGKVEVKKDYGNFPFSQEARNYINKIIKNLVFA